MHREESDVLEELFAGVTKVLADMLGMVSPDALGRGQRLRECMGRFARHLGDDSPWELETGALLSSIGCASMPLSVNRKLANGAELSPAEQAIVERVPQVGHGLISDIPHFREIARIVLYQNKNFDGTGFPDDKVAGDAIPLGARMLKILSDRMTLEADGVVKQRALQAMKERPGTYDPALLEKNFACFDGFLATAISSERKVVSLPIAKLEPGQVVVSDIVSHAGHTLVGSGNVLSQTMLDRLRNFAEIGEVKEPVFVQEAASAA